MSDTKPHNVYVIEEYKDQAGETQSLKTKVGSAFPHKTGGGFNIVLRQNLAVSGRLVVFPPRDDDSAEE